MRKIWDDYKGLILIWTGVVLFIVAILIIIFGLNNNSFAISTDKDDVELDCPETANKGEVVECNVNVNYKTISGRGLEIHLSSSDDLIWKQYTPSSNPEWSIINTGSSSGIVAATNNNLSGVNLVGTIKYQVPTSAVANSLYSITLSDILLAGSSDSEEKTLSGDFVTTIRVKSDTNTLSAISLSSGSINETVKPSTNSYTATVSSDSVTINVTKSDSMSTVLGNLKNIALHYGTNVIKFDVISESGISNTYTITITRPYDLIISESSYVYNKNNNYLYTGNVVDNDVILTTVTQNIDSSLSSKIENNKLIISYESETLYSIDIINFSINDYQMSGKNIIIGKDALKENLLNSISSNGVTFKVFDKNGNETTSSTMADGYTLKVYRNDSLIDEYTISQVYVIIDESLGTIPEAEDGAHFEVIYYIEPGTTCGELKDKIDTNGVITMYKKSNVLADSDIVSTGVVIDISFSENSNSHYSYLTSVLGDSNEDGKVNVMDIIKISNIIVNKTELERLYFYANDYNKDGSVNVRDIIAIANYIVNK